VPTGSDGVVIASVTGLTTRVTLAETAVTCVGVALSVARKLTTLPATTVGAVGVPDKVFPTIESPAGRVPLFRVYVIVPVPPVVERVTGVMAVPTVYVSVLVVGETHTSGGAVTAMV